MDPSSIPDYSAFLLDLDAALDDLARSVIGGGMTTTGEVLSQTWITVPGEFDAALNYRMGGPPASIVKAKVWTNWKPILWFTKGPSDWNYVSDDVNSSGRDRTLHPNFLSGFWLK